MFTRYEMRSRPQLKGGRGIRPSDEWGDLTQRISGLGRGLETQQESGW
jgi:hypothetical protein